MAQVGESQGGEGREKVAGAAIDMGLSSPPAETAQVLEAYLTPPFRADAHRWDDEGQVCSSGRITHRHECPWEWIVEAYFGRMRNNNFLPNSTVTTVLGSKEVTDLGAFQFDITIPVPWALRAIAGSTEATMIERGHVDTERRELTLVCWASWGTIGCCTEKSVYSEVPAEQGSGCILTKTNRVEIHSPMLPKWAVDTFWRVKNRNFPKSREEHERLALRLMEREGQKPGRPVPSLPKHWGGSMCEASPPPSPSPAVGRRSPAVDRGSAVGTATGGESSPRTGGRAPSPEVLHPTKVTVLGSEGDRMSRAVQRRAKARGCFCARRPAKTIADRRPSARSPNGSATRHTENEAWHTVSAGGVLQHRPTTTRVLRKTTSNAATAKKILAQPAAMGPTELLTLIATAEAATQKFSLNVNFSRSDRALKVDSARDMQEDPEDEEDEDWLSPKSEFPVDTWPGIEVVVRAGESRNQATVRTIDELTPGPKTPNLGKEGAYDGPLGYDLLTEVTANCVFRQPWDRLVLTYLYRIHTGLADDLSATLRPIQPAQPGSSILELEYDFALELPAAVRIFAGESHYRWVETVQIDTAERRLRSYSKSPMWTDKFSSLEFIEFHGVDDGVTFCRKGLIADTPRAFPPRWIMNLVAKSYDTRSRETCMELNDFADRAEEIVGAQQPDSLRVWDHLGWDEVTERTPKAELWFSQT